MNDESVRRELGIAEIWEILFRFKKFIWIAPLLCTLAGLIYASSLPKLWEASAVLQIGQVGQITFNAQTGQEAVATQVPAESASSVIARLEHKSFAQGLLELLHIESNKRSEFISLFAKTLKVAQVPNTELVELSLRANSPESAQKFASATIEKLKAAHDEILEPSVTRLKSQIRANSDDIKGATEEIDFLRKQLTGDKNWTSYNATISALVLSNKTNDLRAMSRRHVVLEEQLSPSRTFATRVVGEIYVSENAVTPNVPLILVSAFIFGVMISIILPIILFTIKRKIN